jgi:hypothetical protein
MANRKHTPSETETVVLTKSARRCTLCFYLRGDLAEKMGQIAHLDQDPSNFSEDNLAFMCLDHHSTYDSKTSQHKNYTLAEVKAARERLYATIADGRHLDPGIASPSEFTAKGDNGSTPQGVFIEISVTGSEPKSWNRSEELLLKYAVERTEEMVRITPELGYMNLFNSGGPIMPLDYITSSYCPFGWDFPQIDFKILNRGSQPLYLTEVILDVEESRVDLAPLLAIKRDQQRREAGVLHLVNEGGGDIQGLSIDFHLVPGADPSPQNFDPPFEHHVDLAVLQDRAELDITPAFRDEGVDIDDLIRLSEGDWSESGDLFVFKGRDETEARLTQDELTDRSNKDFGKFQDEVGTLSGVISFENEGESTGRRTVKFCTQIFLSNLNRMGITKPPSYTYDCALEVDGKRYTKRVQISQTLQPGESDRFTTKVATAQASSHRFKARVRDVSGVEFDSPMIELHVFAPRSRRKAVEGKIQL